MRITPIIAYDTVQRMSGPDDTPTTVTAPPDPSPDQVMAQLARILAAPDFAQSERLRRFLQYVVEETLAGRAAALKEYTIALAVFDRDESFDPQSSSIVRVEAGRLRARLDKFNAGQDREDRVRIRLVPGSYVPSFESIADAAASDRPPVDAAGPARISARMAVMVGLGALMIAAAGTIAYLSLYDTGAPTGATSESTATIRSVAVLPLRNMSDDPAQAYFSDGITEALIASLARRNEFPVISMTSALAYKNSAKPVAEIAHELGVSHVVAGSVQRVDDRVRITAELIEAGTDRHLWADSYDRDVIDVLAIQGEVVGKIVGALAGRAAETPALPAAPMIDPAAYEAQLKARYFRNQMTADGFRKSIEYFQQAIDAAPDYALAHSGMASCYCLLSGHGFELVRPHDAMPTAKDAIEKALALDDTLVEPHIFLGFIRLKYDWDWAGAEQTLRHAMALDPYNAQARLFYSIYLEAMGRQDEAIDQARTGLRNDPLSLALNVNLAWQYLQAGRLEDARQVLVNVNELNPDSWSVHWGFGHLHRRAGEFDKAIAAFNRAIAHGGGHTLPLRDLGYTYAVAGDPAAAREVLGRLNAMSLDSHVSPYNIATVHAGLGDVDEALAWLEEAYVERSRSLAWLNVAREYDGLRTDPRFQDLLRRVGLPPAQS